MLRHRRELSLSPEQVQNLQDLRDGYYRDAIRHEADIRMAELDLQSLLRAATVDLEQAKEKLAEIERLKTELRLARIHAIERGKTLLSPEQREKLSDLLDEVQYSRVQ
jgi:Spy/CpxP family protein refolding chaperone